VTGYGDGHYGVQDNRNASGRPYLCRIASRVVALRLLVISAPVYTRSPVYGPESTTALTTKRRIWFLLYAAIITFAALFVWLTGNRGVFLLDQSIMFDGAWRVFQGQVPYRDFFSAFPPVPFVIQALFFVFLGIDFSATVVSAAAFNAAATACVIYLVRRLLPEQRAIAAAGGLLTSVWFQAPFGTLWFEQTAFAFNLLALLLVIRAATADARLSVWLRAAAGVSVALAMLSKQNAGVEFIPILIGVIAFPHARQLRKAMTAVGQLLAGLMFALGIFLVWLWWFSSPAAFWHDYVVMARQIGADRFRTPLRLLLMFLPLGTMGRCVLPLIGFSFAFGWSRRSSSQRNRGLITWIVLGCIFYQNLFSLHTSNEIENCLPYLGLIYALSIGLLVQALRDGAIPQHDFTIKPLTRAAYVCSIALVLAVPFYDGILSSWSRMVQEFGPGTRFAMPLQVPGMSTMKWAEPTMISSGVVAHRTELSREDFEALNAWLSTTDSNFFVFKDSIILYGLHHRVSPQPWLYFSPGHSFLQEELPRVDAVVVESLHRNNIQVIVLEKESWLEDGDLWMKMPRLRSWIMDDFEYVKEFGIYQVFRRRSLGDRFNAARQ